MLAGLSMAQTPVWSHAGPSSMLSPAWGLVAGPILALASGPGGAPVYAAGAGGVWERSGSGWVSLGPAPPVEALAVTPAGTLIAATPSGLVASSDKGWQALAGSGGFTVTQIAIDPANAQHWLLATPGGLLASADGGVTFTATSITDAVLGVRWQGSEVVAVTAHALGVSSDAGANFTVAGVSPPAGCTAAAVALPGDGSFLILLQGPSPELLSLIPGAGAPGGLALPADWDATAVPVALAAGGGNVWLAGRDVWQQAPGAGWNNLTETSAAGAALPAGQTAVLAQAPGSVVVANRHGVWAGGAGAWTNWNNGLMNPAPVGLAWTGQGNLVVALASGSVALGHGASWTVAGTQGLTAVQQDPAALNAVHGITANALLHSSDGGASWTPAAVAASPPYTALTASAQAALVGTAGGEVGATSGATVNSPAPGHAVSALASSADGQQLWLAAGAQLWSSSDSGTSWQPLAFPFGAIHSLAWQPGGGVLAAATPGEVALSWSGGNGWTLLSAGLPASLPVTAAGWDASGMLWAATYGEGLWAIVPGASNMNLNLKIPVSAPAGASLPFSLQLMSSLGPVVGATLTVASSAGGVSGPSVTVTTAVDGSATGSLPMPAQAGVATVIAALSGAGQPILSPPQSVQVVPGVPAMLTVISGANQQQTAGLALPLPIVLRLSDAFGNPLAGQTLQVTGPQNFKQNLTTDGSGQAELSAYRLPSQVGAVALAAAIGNVSVAWSETALPPPDYQITLTAPSAAAAPNATVDLTLEIVPIGLFSSPVNLTCLPVLECQVTQAGQPIGSLAPGVQAQVELSTGTLGSQAANVAVTVQADSSHFATVSVPLQSLALALGANAVTLAAGQTLLVPVTVSGLNGLTAQVALSVAGANAPQAANLEASLQPASVSLSGSAAASTAQLQLSAAVGSSGQSPPLGLAGLYLALAGCVCLARRRRMAALVAFTALACACGGGAVISPVTSAPPPPSQVTLTVTAQGGGLQTSATLPVTLTSP